MTHALLDSDVVSGELLRYRLLHLEDNPLDAELLQQRVHDISRPCDIHVVDSRDAYVAALTHHTFDLILCNYRISGYSGLAAIDVAQQLQPGVPIIIVSGSTDEEEAVTCLHRGATDYLSKTRLERFGPAVSRALHEAERRRARIDNELELRHGQTLLQTASRLMLAGGWMLETSDQSIVWTDAAAAIHDWPIGSSPTLDELCLRYAPQSRERFRELVGRCLEYGTPYDQELEVLTPLGRRVWVRAVGEAAYGPDGSVARLQGAMQDITRVKRVDDERSTLLSNERRLREDAESATLYFRSLFESTPGLYLVLSPEDDYRIIAVNNAYLKATMTTREDILGKPLFDVFPDDPHAATADGAMNLRASLDRVMALGRADVMAVQRYPSQRPDGTFEERFWSPINTPVPGAHGHVAYIIHSVEDVTDFIAGKNKLVDVRDHDHLTAADQMAADIVLRSQQLQELNQQLREQASLLDKTRDAIFVMDLRHRITYWNKGAERMYGWTGAEAIGQYAESLLGTASPAVQTAFEAVTAHDQWTGEMHRVTPEGRELTIEAHWTLVRDASGAPKNVLAVSTDLTDRRQLERQYQQAQKMQSIGQLAGGIAHDFNNLLTVINGLADLTLRAPLPDPLRQDILEIRGAGERAATLTRQLLAFSRKQILQPEIVNLNSVIRDMERMLGRLIGEDIQLVVQTDTTLRDVYLDTGQVEQVIANIAVNARDAMPDGGRLTITTKNIEVRHERRIHGGAVIAPGYYVELSMSDAGCGMDEATRERVFEPFFTTKGAAGTGLGLATVYGIVKQSSGFITVASEVGHGTTMTLIFPVAHGEPAPTTITEPIASTVGDETILVVEDVVAIRNLAKRTLETAGYAVVTAANGKDAVKLLQSRSEPIHLVVTDVVMPLMGGRTLAEWCEQHRPSTRILFTSGYTDDIIIRNGVSTDRFAFLSKPFAVHELLGKVREILDHAHV